MNTIEYKKFKKEQVPRFRKYYRECINLKQKKGLKNALYDNPNLTELQKDYFWKEVINEKI